MAEYITLKSQALEIYDYHRVDISQFLTGFVADDAQLEKDMQRQLRRYGTVVSADRVENGDTAVLRCRSKLPRFQADAVTVAVGKGLFDRQIEQGILGMNVGECRCVHVGGEAVEVELICAKRTQLPERTDEAIAALHIDGITSINDLRLLCLQKQVDGFLLEDENPDMASAYIWQEVAKNSTFRRDESEIALMDRRAEKKQADMQQRGELNEEDGLNKDVFF